MVSKAQNMVGFQKKIHEDSFEYRFYRSLGFPPVSDSGDIPLVIRITLGDMELIDGFYMSLPENAGNLSIEGAIRKYVLCEDEEDRLDLRRKLSTDPNPDLSDAYGSLLDLYKQADAGEVTMIYHINNGASDVQPTELVNMHVHRCKVDDKRDYRLLDIVLEVYDNIDPFAGLKDEQKGTMLMNFRSTFILYLMDKFGYQPMQDMRHEVRDSIHLSHASSLKSHVLFPHLSIILGYLTPENVGLLGVDEEYYITPRGYDLLNGIADEAEFYIGNYDIFGDVYVKRGREVRFNTGYGDNLIVPVFMREGIDPYRALFVTALYLGNLDWLASDLTMLFSEEPFKELLKLIVSSPAEGDIGNELLDRIIREGKSKVEERKLSEARLKYIEDIKRRMKEL